MSNILLESDLLQNKFFWTPIFLILLLLFVIIIICVAIFWWGKQIYSTDFAKQHSTVNKLINFEIKIENNHYQTIDFFEINGKLIYPFGIRQIQLRLFYQLINSKNKYKVQRIIEEMPFQKQKVHNIRMPILIKYRNKLLYFFLKFNYFDSKNHKIYGTLIQNDFSIVYNDLITDYRQLAERKKDLLVANNLQPIISNNMDSTTFLENFKKKINEKKTIITRLVRKSLRQDSRLFKLCTKAKKNSYKKNVILVCISYRRINRNSRFFQKKNQELYSYYHSANYYIKECVSEIFKKNFLTEIVVPDTIGLAIYLVQSKQSTSKTLKYLRFKHILKINKLAKKIKNKIPLMSEVDNQAHIRITNFYFEHLRLGTFVHNLIRKNRRLFKTEKLSNLMNQSDNNKFFRYYSKNETNRLEHEFKRQAKKRKKDFNQLNFQYRIAQVYDYDKKCIIGVVPLLTSSKDSKKIVQIVNGNEKESLRIVSKGVTNFKILLKKLDFETIVLRFQHQLVFYPLDVKLFLHFRDDWVKFFRNNKNFVPCFKKLFVSINKVLEAMQILTSENIIFGAYNFSLIDPANHELVLDQKMLRFFFPSEKSINYMIKFPKYFLPGIANMEDFKLCKVKVIFPFRQNQFYFHKFRNVNANFFVTENKVSNILSLTDFKN